MPTFDDVQRIGGALPQVVETPSCHGSPALKVAKRPFCRLWSEREHDRDGVSGGEVLVVFCDLAEKEALGGSAPAVRASSSFSSRRSRDVRATCTASSAWLEAASIGTARAQR
jgi:hypothetical protein